MKGDGRAPPGLDIGQEGVGHILVVHEPLSHLDGQGTAQHTAHAAHYALYCTRPLQQR